MHDEQVMQIVIATGETAEKVCMVAPVLAIRRDRAPRQLYTELLLT